MKSKFTTLLAVGGLLLAGTAQAQFNEELISPLKSPVNRPLTAFESLILGHDVTVMQDADTVNVGMWLNREKYVAPVNSQGRVTQFGSYEWNSTNNSWDGATAINNSYDYNSNNQLTAVRRQIVQDDSSWIVQTWNYTLNSSGKPETSMGWDSIVQGSTIIGVQRADSFTYDGSGNWTEQVTYYVVPPFGGQPRERVVYTYNSSNEVTDMTRYQWESNAWEPDVNRVYTWTGSNMTSAIELNYNGTAWDSSEYEMFTYDTNNKVATYEMYSWNGQGWSGDEKQDVTWGANGITDAVIYEWNGSSWDLDDHAVPTYTGTAIDFILIYPRTGSSWSPVAANRIIYSDPITGVREAGAGALFGMYPNPVNDKLTIESANPVSVVIMDLNGRVVLSSAHVDGSVDVSGLNSGLYLVRISGENGSQMSRLVKN
jgi:hypothetical protein